MTGSRTTETLASRIGQLLATEPGLSDREIADRLLGPKRLQPANQTCRALEREGRLRRAVRGDGRLGNYPTGVAAPTPVAATVIQVDRQDEPELSEEEVKRHVAAWLEGQDWHVKVRWGHQQGIDIETTEPPRDGPHTSRGAMTGRSSSGTKQLSL